VKKEKLEQRINHLERLIRMDRLIRVLKQAKVEDVRLHTVLETTSTCVMDWSVLLGKSGRPKLTVITLDERDYGMIRLMTDLETQKSHIEVINRYANRRFTRLLHGLCLSRRLRQDRQSIQAEQVAKCRRRLIEYLYPEA